MTSELTSAMARLLINCARNDHAGRTPNTLFMPKPAKPTKPTRRTIKEAAR